MDDSVSIFHLILESRHFTLCLMNALKFWICCLLTLGCIQGRNSVEKSSLTFLLQKRLEIRILFL